MLAAVQPTKGIFLAIICWKGQFMVARNSNAVIVIFSWVMVGYMVAGELWDGWNWGWGWREWDLGYRNGAACCGCVDDDGGGQRCLGYAAVARQAIWGARGCPWVGRSRGRTEGRSRGVERGGRQSPLEERQGRDTMPQGGVWRGGRCSCGG